MKLETIVAQVEEIKSKSESYQDAMFAQRIRQEDVALRGHIGYWEKEKVDNLTPSDEYMTAVFKDCAAKLGFEYEYR